MVFVLGTITISNAKTSVENCSMNQKSIAASENLDCCACVAWDYGTNMAEMYGGLDAYTWTDMFYTYFCE